MLITCICINTHVFHFIYLFILLLFYLSILNIICVDVTASMYDGSAVSYPYDSADLIGPRQTLPELFTNCVQPNMLSALDSVVPLLLICLVCSVVSRVPYRYLRHAMLSALGGYALHRFFALNSLILCKYYTLACNASTLSKTYCELDMTSL